VLTVCMLRVETLRGDAKSVKQTLDLQVEQYVRIVAQHHDITDRISTLAAGLHETGLRISNLDESITSTNNKLASRDRADRIAQTRNRREEPQVDAGDIPGTKQQIIDFSKIPGAIPLHPAVPREPVIREREFGEYPEEWII